VLKENNFNLKIFHLAKLSFRIEGRIKDFHDEQNLEQYIATKSALWF
jgi:hypothetical protein